MEELVEMQELVEQVADFIDYLNANQINSEVVENLLDQYIKEKHKNRKIKESLTFRIGNHQKENHTMNYAKLNKNNKFGHNGVCEDKRHKRKKYRAYITLHGKQYSLGTYDDLETAIKARKNGEEMIKKMKGAK